MKKYSFFLTFMVLVMVSGVPVTATTPHTINVDGNTSDFADDELIWADSSSDCSWDFNELYNLYATWDENALYIGVDFLIEEANSISMYMDLGYGDGAHDLSTVSWYKYFYTQNWLANFSVNCSGNATDGVFRIYDDNSHDEWTSNPNIQKQINLGNGQYEVKIPWSVLYSGGFKPGAYMKLVCTLTGYRGYDGADAMPQQTVEPNGDGGFDTLDVLYRLDFDQNGDGIPETGWHPNTNSGAAGEPPVADARANPTSGPAPLEVAFEGIGNDPDGGTVSYSWDFGDGSSSNEQNPVHTYTTAGTYDAVLTVTDDEMATATDSVTIIVTGGGSDDPVLDLTLSQESPDCFRGGDYFDLQYTIVNPGDITLNVDLYVLLDVYGIYFFWPSWSDGFDYKTVSVNAESDLSEAVLQCNWPAGTGAASDLKFYAAMFQPGSFTMVGNFDFLTFCYQ